MNPAWFGQGVSSLENFDGHWRFWKKSVISNLWQVIILTTAVYKIQFTWFWEGFPIARLVLYALKKQKLFDLRDIKETLAI